ncbi:MAG: cation:proton antiporter [Proteobacteria bacterium]|nr:cation:proton antiporter [Pseudomonadota bacterium]
MSELIILRDLAVIFGVGVCVVVLLRKLGVPTIAGFIVAGVLVGPHTLGLVDDVHKVEVLAEVGVALLLFGIGLEIDLARLRQLWHPVILGGALQMSLSVSAATVIAVRYGLAVNSAIFAGCLIGVSSTAIVLRGLEARGEADAPHGRFTLGILVFQDLSVVPMMLAIPLLAGAESPAGTILMALLKTVGVLCGVLISAWFLVPRLLHWIANTRQRELFVLMVFLVSMGTAWVASEAGVSLSLGAFLAGLVVAGSEYRHQAMADLIPFREVLTSLFFVSIGMLFDPGTLWERPATVLGLLSAIVAGKFVVVFLTGTLMRLAVQVNVLAGLALCQVGEFSLVLLHAAEGTGLLDGSLAANLLAVAILSMLVTPLALAAGPRLAAGAGKLRVLSRLLGVPTAEEGATQDGARWSDHVLIAGYGLTGQELAKSLQECRIPFVIADVNPKNVHLARSRNEPAYFGDVTSAEVLDFLGASRAREIVLLVNDPGAAERAIAAVRQVAPKVHLVVRSRYLADVRPLLAAGASEVIAAELEAAVEVAAHMLGRHGVPLADKGRHLGRIRQRREEEPATDAQAVVLPSRR